MHQDMILLDRETFDPGTVFPFPTLIRYRAEAEPYDLSPRL